MQVLLRLMLILGIQLQRENMRDLNVAIVDCRVIPLIVVTNCMDTHLGTSLDPRLNWARPKLIRPLLLCLRT